MSRVFLVNVGSNASHSFCSPIFEDRTFEFIPIPEDRELDPLYGVQYKHLKSFNFPENDLMKFVPEKFWNRTMHSDPEFDTFTYGDNCDVNPRASSLKTVERGDFLLFLSRLQSWRNNAFQNDTKRVVKSLGVPVKFSQGPVKGIGRVLAKAETKYVDERYPKGKNIGDIVRNSIYAKDAQSLYTAVTGFIEKIEGGEGGCIKQVLQFKNGFKNVKKWNNEEDAHYVDINNTSNR